MTVTVVSVKVGSVEIDDRRVRRAIWGLDEQTRSRVVTSPYESRAP